eukprot:1661110-Karenia_brevis.AAC.1
MEKCKGTLEEALLWQAGTAPNVVLQRREAMILKIEEARQKMFESGLCADWLGEVDEGTRTLMSG